MLFLLFSLQLSAPAADFCHRRGPRAPSADLYCVDLVPAPDFPEASGVVRLDRAPSPFGIAVTPAGVLRFVLTITPSGLPVPESLGAYSTYIAWVTTPTFDTMIKLGPVSNDRRAMGEVALNKFIVLISAENSSSGSERKGPLVLRGTSPSVFMQPHGVNVLPPQSVPLTHDHHSDQDGWTMPPSYPGVTPMIPGLERMRPPVTPFLPIVDSKIIPQARPRELVRVKDGDTLMLEAGLVRRSLGGHQVTMYAFDGQYPGPLIQVRQNSTIVVRFRNRLDQPSSIHWHGIRLDNRFDGVPDMTQDAVPPGSSFDYTVHFPDAGLYWYHPHVREDLQQDLGLYGNLLVRSNDSGYYGPSAREAVLMLDDLLVGDEGLVPFGKERPTHAIMGRFGNVLLVNGETHYRLDVRAGEVVRFFLTDVSNVRSWNLSIPGARLKVVAGDESRFEHEEWVENVTIAPAERYVVEARFERPGRRYLLNRVQALDHQTGIFISEIDTLGTIAVANRRVGRNTGSGYHHLRRFPDVDPSLRDSLKSVPVHTLLLSLKLRDSLPYGLIQAMRLDTVFLNPVEWSGTMPMMDWLTTGSHVEWVLRDMDSGKENMAIDWHFRRGTLAHIRLVNDRHSLHGMQHPIHLHGQRFLVLAQNDVATDNLVWKDTALVPAGGTLDLLVDFSNPGTWMLHCHIAEHLEAGMHMAVVVDH